MEILGSLEPIYASYQNWNGKTTRLGSVGTLPVLHEQLLLALDPLHEPIARWEPEAQALR